MGYDMGVDGGSEASERIGRAIRGSVVGLRIQRGHVVWNYTVSGLVATVGIMALVQEGISVHVPRVLLAFGVHPEYIQSTSSLLDGLRYTAPI